jgi:hypothetical protein
MLTARLRASVNSHGGGRWFSASVTAKNAATVVRGQLSKSGSVLDITLCSPKTRNALSLDVMKAMRQEMSKANQDINVIILITLKLVCIYHHHLIIVFQVILGC